MERIMRTYTNLRIVTVDSSFTVYENGFISVEGKLIQNIGDMKDFASDGEVIIDCEGMIAIPGLINAHTHLGLIPLRSLGEDMPDRLRKYLFPMEQKYMDKETVVAASHYAALESLLNGTTTVADMYYYAEDVAKELDDVGIRALVGQTIIETSQIDYGTEEKALEHTQSLIEQWKDHDRIKPMIAPHSPVSVSEASLLKIRDLSKLTDTKVMMHVSEMDYEMEHFAPSTPVAYLDSIDLIDKNFLGVHMIHTNDNDQRIMKKNGAHVIHCPGANMKAGKGITDLKGFYEHGVKAALGTDGPISGNTLDIMTVMKLVAMGQKTKYHERDIFPSSMILEMATINGAKALGIDEHTGSLEIGKRADVVLISTEEANMYPLYDPIPSIVYQVQTQNIHTVMVDGKVLVENHKLTKHSINDARNALNEVVNKISQNS